MDRKSSRLLMTAVLVLLVVGVAAAFLLGTG